jgi:hypothetical protein
MGSVQSIPAGGENHEFYGYCMPIWSPGPTSLLGVYMRDPPMPRENSDSSNDWNQRQRALSRWDDEGGAGPDGPATVSAPDNERVAIPELTNAELVTLRIRVIALENLMISLLAIASDDQLKLAREMAGYISPRPCFTQHPLTIHAAAHMVDLVERANHFRDFES